MTAFILVLVVAILGLLAILALVLRGTEPSDRPEIVRAIAELLGRRPR